MDQFETAELDKADMHRVCLNMYTACSYFVEKSKPKGRNEKIIKEECLNFLAIMIQKLHEESK